MPTLAKNKEAYYNYTILEEFEAGLVLSGQEVKSVRLGQVSMKGSYITFFEHIPQLVNCHISAYKPAGEIAGYEPTHPRPLLLKKKRGCPSEVKDGKRRLDNYPAFHLY